MNGPLVHDLRGPQRRSKVQMHVYVIQKLLNCLVHSVENAIQRPMNAYDRASRQFFFNIVKQSTGKSCQEPAISNNLNFPAKKMYFKPFQQKIEILGGNFDLLEIL